MPLHWRTGLAAVRTMDKRLNQIQTGSLTDSRLNDDFVFWLKTKGLNYLLIVLVIGCAYMGWNWYHRVRSQSRADAWLRLERATTPQELAVVATEDGSVDSIAILAKVRSANTYLGSILRGVRYDRDATAEDAKITPELRAEWLENADQLFADIDRTLSQPNTPPALTPTAFHALMGRAAVAEARGDADATRRYLDAAAARATGPYAPLAEVARRRADGVAAAALGAELPPRAALPNAAPPPTLAPTITPSGSGAPITLTPTAPPPGMPALPMPRPPVNSPAAPSRTPPAMPPPSSAPAAPSAPPSAPPAPSAPPSAPPTP